MIFEQCETHEQFKERETFWQHRLKTFFPIGLNEREEHHGLTYMSHFEGQN